MSANVILFGWNHPVPGRERISVDHFKEFVRYLETLRQQGMIQSFDPVILNLHGGT